MTSEVEICNMALSKIRAGSINDLSENSLQAQQCSLWYPKCRAFLQEGYDWGFALKIEALAVLSTEDIFNWVYVYQYPTDCLHLNRLILNYEEFTATDGAYRTRHLEDIYTPDLEQQIPYELYNVGGGNDVVIAANEPDLRAEYRFRVTDPNLFSAAFVEAFAAYLASKLAIPIVGGEVGRALRKDALEEYQYLLSSAVSNSRDQRYQEPQDSEFITIRR